ncbi:MAG: hypothetical protein LBK01_00375 [Burkholderiaceae bacterium]|jgi:hypothetical protein|nr:hypothetical protein [Burkholderiaceae bacterium]
MNSMLLPRRLLFSSHAHFISNPLRGMLVACFVSFACGTISPALAEDITYRGSSGDLQDPPAYLGGGSKNTLAPAGYTRITNNTITIDYSSGTDPENVWGGYSANGSVTSNRVTLQNGKVKNLHGGYSNRGNVTNNTVTINGGIVDMVTGGTSDRGSAVGVSGKSSNRGSATNNTVSISDGIVDMVTGGYSREGTATGNTVTISGGTVHGDVDGGFSMHGNATGNAVIISGGAVRSGVDGGFSMHNSATANTVTLKNASVGKKIVGGAGARKAGAATGNTVTLSGEITFVLSTDILGGRGATVSDNTLNLVRFKQMGAGRVGRVGNFDRLHFSGLKAGQTNAVLTAADVNLDNSRTTLQFDGKPGTVRLIEARNLRTVNARIDPVEYGGVRYGFHWDSNGNAVVGNSGVGE